jgi:type II pantothenate kinase
MAMNGDLTRVDLTVGDIAGGPVGIVPASATASNFGKVRSDPTPADKAAALVNMVAEGVIKSAGVVSNTAICFDIPHALK